MKNKLIYKNYKWTKNGETKGETDKGESKGDEEIYNEATENDKPKQEEKNYTNTYVTGIRGNCNQTNRKYILLVFLLIFLTLLTFQFNSNCLLTGYDTTCHFAL